MEVPSFHFGARAGALPASPRQQQALDTRSLCVSSPPPVPLTMPGAPKVALGSRNDLLVLEEALQAAAAACAAGARVRALPEAERQDVEKALKQMTVRGARV